MGVRPLLRRRLRIRRRAQRRTVARRSRTTMASGEPRSARVTAPPSVRRALRSQNPTPSRASSLKRVGPGRACADRPRDRSDLRASPGAVPQQPRPGCGRLRSSVRRSDAATVEARVTMRKPERRLGLLPTGGGKWLHCRPETLVSPWPHARRVGLARRAVPVGGCAPTRTEDARP